MADCPSAYLHCLSDWLDSLLSTKLFAIQVFVRIVECLSNCLKCLYGCSICLSDCTDSLFCQLCGMFAYDYDLNNEVMSLPVSTCYLSVLTRCLLVLMSVWQCNCQVWLFGCLDSMFSRLHYRFARYDFWSECWDYWSTCPEVYPPECTRDYR